MYQSLIRKMLENKKSEQQSLMPKCSSPQATIAANVSQAEQDPLNAFIKGTMVGLGVPIITVPLDKLQAHIVINNPATRINVIATLSESPFFKGYGLNASTNVIRYGLIFNLTPVLETYFNQHGGDPQTDRVFAWAGAGMLEGLIMSPRAMFAQQLYTTNAGSCVELVRQAKVDSCFGQKLLVSAKFAAMRDGIYWPIFRKGIETLERELHVKEQEASIAKNVEEFLIGAVSGWLASGISYLPDVVQKHALNNLHKHEIARKDTKVTTICQTYRKPELPSLIELDYIIAQNQEALPKPRITLTAQYKHAWHEYGLQMFPKFCYKGYLSMALRMFVASGATNILIHKANGLYTLLAKRNLFSINQSPATGLPASDTHSTRPKI